MWIAISRSLASCSRAWWRQNTRSPPPGSMMRTMPRAPQRSQRSCADGGAGACVGVSVGVTADSFPSPAYPGQPIPPADRSHPQLRRCHTAVTIAESEHEPGRLRRSSDRLTAARPHGRRLLRQAGTSSPGPKRVPVVGRLRRQRQATWYRLALAPCSPEGVSVATATSRLERTETGHNGG